jgi:multisubunit Na+/H+ antiporter MnhC subunit
MKDIIIEFFTMTGIAFIIAIGFYIFTKENTFAAIIAGMALIKSIEAHNLSTNYIKE